MKHAQQTATGTMRLVGNMKHFKVSFISIISLILLFNPVNTFALVDQTSLFYQTNDILFYDPNAVPCQTGSDLSSSSTNAVNSSKNAEIILRYLTGKGLTLKQAAGFVGNMQQESGLNPKIIQGGTTAPDDYSPVDGRGFGLVQWTFTSRQQPLVNLAKKSNKPVTDINVQLDYIWQEVSGRWKSTLQALEVKRDTLTPTQAAIIVHGRTNKVSSDSRFSSPHDLVMKRRMTPPILS